MKKIFFLFLSFFISQFNSVNANTVSASLWINPKTNQMVLVCGDVHILSKGKHLLKEEKYANFYLEGFNQFEELVSIVKEFNKNSDSKTLFS